MSVQPTLLGHIGAVAGASISIRQSENVESGLPIIGGRTYRVGQVGSFVRIPQGYHNLFGIISDVGATAAPEALAANASASERWMKVQLVGEIVEVTFERGVSQFPSINDEVHLVTEEDLAKIYGGADGGQIAIGRLAGAESIPAKIDLDKLVTRHCAVLGSTGAGKSTTVASLMRSIAGNGAFLSARILLLDIHGEYASSFKGNAKVFRTIPTSDEEHALHIPYWALETLPLLHFLLGRLDDRPLTAILDKVLAAKQRQVATGNYPGADLNALTADSPIPYSLKQLWFELIDPEVRTWADQQRTSPAMMHPGDAKSLTLPRYKPHGAGNAAPFINTLNVLSIRRQLDQMRSRLLDRQFDFLLHPGAWEPDEAGVTPKDLAHLLKDWLGHEKPITILDLSGVPSSVLGRLVGSILNILYEGLFWGREYPEGGKQRPQLIVMEEAHRYLGRDADGPAKEMVQRIVKEGRKFGIGAMIVSQRPSEIDETILSQCGTFFSLRLSNAADRGRVQAALPDSLAGLMDMLPVLRTGEAIVTGEAAKLPVRCRITLPPTEARPSSGDADVTATWVKNRGAENYDRVVSAWRAQNAKWKPARGNHGKNSG